MTVKKIFAAALIALSVLLTACASSYTAVMSVENKTSYGWESSYKKLDGRKDVTLNVPSGNGCIVTGLITTDSGSISIEIQDSDKNVVYSSEAFAEDGSFEATLDNSGRYKVYLVANEHSGAVELNWSFTAIE